MQEPDDRAAAPTDARHSVAELHEQLGSAPLRVLGRALRQLSRAGDLVARLGSDSFGVVLRNPLVVGPARLASRLRDVLKGLSLTGPRGFSGLSPLSSLLCCCWFWLPPPED